MRCPSSSFYFFLARLVLSSAFAVAASSAAEAATTRPYTVSPLVGVFVPGSLSDQGAGVLAGVKVDTPVTNQFSVEGGVSLLSLDGNEKGGEAILMGLQMLYPLTEWRRLSPFLSFGVGGIVASSGHSGPLVSFGVGSKYFLAPRFALRGEVRDVASTGTGNSLELSMGLSFLFGGEEIPKVRRRPPLRRSGAVEPAPPAAPVPPAPPVPATVAVAETPLPDAPNVVEPAAVVEPVATVAAEPEATAAAPVQVAAVAEADEALADDIEVPLPPDATEAQVDAVAEDAATASQEWDLAAAKKDVEVVVEFDPGRSQIRTSNVKVMTSAGLHLKYKEKTVVFIVGHTDSTGIEAKNEVLARKRAERVKQYLINMYQIPPERIRTDGKAATQPIADNATAEGRQKNRRAVINVLELDQG